MDRKKLRVLVDLDSIVVNIEDRWYTEYNRLHGDDLSIEKVTDWNVAQFCKAGDAIFEVLKRPGFFEELKPLPGAIEGLHELLDDPAIDLYIVSSAPHPGAYSEKARWLQRWLPEFDLKHLVLTYSKALVCGDVLFDDGPHNLLAYREAWPHAKLATIAYPYNTKAHHVVDLVVGTYGAPYAAWRVFVNWVEELAHPHPVYMDAGVPALVVEHNDDCAPWSRLGPTTCDGCLAARVRS